MIIMNTKTVSPSPALYAEVRAGFVRQHSSLNKWCKTNGARRQNARDALLGVWTGRKARLLIERLVNASQTP